MYTQSHAVQEYDQEESYTRRS